MKTNPDLKIAAMNRILLLALFASTLGSFALQGQSCLPEGIEFNTQAEINNFAINYPGCTEIEGDVHVYDEFSTGSIVSLNGLSALNRIGGDLQIVNTSLTSLEGLENIDFLGGLLVENNEFLTSLSGLESLDSVQGLFTIIYNGALSNIQALENLSYVGDIFLFFIALL